MKAGPARRLLAGAATALLVLLAVPGIVRADEAEPSIITLAWYWENQQNENVTTPLGDFAVELPNPFCPGVSGLGGSGLIGEACVQGRLPIEVINGDYEEPDKVSAVTFDLSMVPPGSTVSDFSVDFLEAEAGCRESGDTTSGQACEQTDAQNADGKELQACLVTEIFGDGEARPYGTMPKFECSDTDPVATRKEIKNDAKTDPDDVTVDHVWTFDLTSFAVEWTKEFSVVTSIMFRPKAPEGADDPTPDDLDWRVVLAGPRYPEGVKTNIQFEPPKTETSGPPSGGAGPATGLGSGNGFGSDPGGGFGTTTGTGTVPGSDPGPATTDDPLPGETEETGAALPEVETMPGYLWLGLLAGLIGFFLLRSILFERASGVRPGGVLAQIHGLNANRRGAIAAAAAGPPGPLAVVGRAVVAASHAIKTPMAKLGSLVKKIPFVGRR